MKNKKSFLKGALLGALVVCLMVSLVACAQIVNKKDKSVESESKINLLEELVNGNYLKDVDEKSMQEGMYKGYISGLNDPYSVYYDEEETKSMTESTEGIYFGIGALLSQDRNTGIITISRVYADSPAEEAGLREKDILYKVEEKEVTGVDLSEVVKGIKGEEGTDVKLTILRGEEAEEIQLTATRGEVEIETVMAEMKEGAVGYIQISEFDAVTYEQYKTALEQLESQGMERLIIDLRANPGGNLDTVCDMLDLMLPEGTIVSVKDKSGKEKTYRSDAEHTFTKPIVVLVNEYSASASEIFAAAIQDYDLGDIVGVTTYGKGVVQQVFELTDGTSVKLTIAEYFPPSGNSIDGRGIIPDVEEEYVYDEQNPEHDNQLEKAMEVVKNK